MPAPGRLQEYSHTLNLSLRLRLEGESAVQVREFRVDLHPCDYPQLWITLGMNHSQWWTNDGIGG